MSGSERRDRPTLRMRRHVLETTPKAVTMSDADPFNQNPRPATNENVVASAVSAEDQPFPPPQASYVHASAHARPAAKAPNVGSAKRSGIPRRFNPAVKERRNFTAIEEDKVVCPAASIVSMR